MQRCPICDTEKPLTAFRKTSGSGRRRTPYCMECANARKRALREIARRECAGEITEKPCSRCKRTLPIGEFAWMDNHSEYLARSTVCSGCLDPEGIRRCNRCGEVKPKSEWGRRSDRRYSQYCKPCTNDHELSVRYNLSPDELELF